MAGDRRNTRPCFMKVCTARCATARSTSPPHADLKIGVVPSSISRWIQKIHRDRATRGYTTEAVTGHDPAANERVCSIVHNSPRRIINFQRVPIVDTSNRSWPAGYRRQASRSSSSASGSARHRLLYLVAMIQGSWMTRANSIVIPGDKAGPGDQLILTPNDLQARRTRAFGEIALRTGR